MLKLRCSCCYYSSGRMLYCYFYACDKRAIVIISDTVHNISLDRRSVIPKLETCWVINSLYESCTYDYQIFIMYNNYSGQMMPHVVLTQHAQLCVSLLDCITYTVIE